MGKFDGQVAIVTGGSRGLGLAIAQALAAERAGVAIVARSMTTLQEAVQTVQAAGGRALALPADVTDPHAVTWLVKVSPQAAQALPTPGSGRGFTTVNPWLWTWAWAWQFGWSKTRFSARSDPP